LAILFRTFGWFWLSCSDHLADFGYPVQNIWLILAILFRTFSFIASKTLNYWFSNLSIMSVPDEGYSKKRVVRTKFNIYVFIRRIDMI
jgi:hypothetical protein